MSDDTRERSTNAARDASAPPNGSDGNQTMLQPDGHLDAEMVSAWLDTPDDFSEQDRLAIETHLAGCAQCTLLAAELTAIVRAFQTLPLVEAPRSFALTPEMAGLAQTPTLPSSRQMDTPATQPASATTPVYVQTAWYERQMSRLRWATAIATLLFVFTFSADLLGNIDTSGGDDDDSAMFVERPMSTGAEQAGASAEVTATPDSGAAMPEEEAADDAARNSAETPNPAEAAEEEAAGSGLAATEASGDVAVPTQAAADTDEGADEPTVTDAETMLMIETAEPEQEEIAQQEDQTTAAYSGEDTSAENRESDTLRLIELALVITIAWLIVAMIALPRLRRPTG